jgi:hypothetical protein
MFAPSHYLSLLDLDVIRLSSPNLEKTKDDVLEVIYKEANDNILEDILL